jgi:hypothetical protein
MESNKKNSKIKFEISNLIDDAVNNALARRNPERGSEDSLFTLSDEESGSIAGGFAKVADDFAVAGGRIYPITNGGLIPPISELL